MRKKWRASTENLFLCWNTRYSTFFVGKTIYVYKDSSWNIDCILIFHNVPSSPLEMVPNVWRWSHMVYLTDGKWEGRPATVSKPNIVQWMKDVNYSNCKVIEAHIACSKNLKYIWVKVNFWTMTRFRKLFQADSRTKEWYSIV